MINSIFGSKLHKFPLTNARHIIERVQVLLHQVDFTGLIFPSFLNNFFNFRHVLLNWQTLHLTHNEFLSPDDQLREKNVHVSLALIFHYNSNSFVSRIFRDIFMLAAIDSNDIFWWI